VFSKIVVGTDGSGTANAAVALAVDLAQKFAAELHLVNAFHSTNAAVAVAQAGVIAAGAVEISTSLLQSASEEMLAEAAATATGCSVVTHAIHGAPAEALLRVAESTGADLLVVGSKGMKRRVIGSVPNSVAHGAPCHVLIAKTT
jgi:nucleotide-binding universal stress UspA family protein